MAATPVPAALRPRLCDPMPVAFALFAFALAIYGVRYVSVDASTVSASSTSAALVYAILVTGIAELVAGVLGLIRGQAFLGYVTSVFGIWLLGLYCLFTAGAARKDFAPDAVGWYVLVLLVPVLILAVPDVRERNYPAVIAYVAITGLLITLGSGFLQLNHALDTAVARKSLPELGSTVDLLKKTSAYFAFTAAAAIWYIMARDVYRITGVSRTPTPTTPDDRPPR